MLRVSGKRLQAVLIATLCCAMAQPGLGQGTAKDDSATWNEFAEWVKSAAPPPGAERMMLRVRYVEHLISTGVPREEAARRFSLIDAYRRGSIERERIYWDGVFKFRGGPNTPLRLLQESVRDVKPGSALDIAMGGGRNAVYLASLGWKVTGYDMSREAIAAARQAAESAKVNIEAVEATHESFEFGESRWDLAVISYSYVNPADSAWSTRLYRALKPGGMVVIQETMPASVAPADLLANWKAFRVLRYEQPETSSDDWLPNQPYLRIVLRKP